MANDEHSGASFQTWKYKHYFSLLETKEKNIVVSCRLCAGKKTLSTSKTSNSNLTKHLMKQHPSTKSVAAREPDAEHTVDPGEATVSSTEQEGPTPSKQPRLDFKSLPAFQYLSQERLHRLIAKYAVEDTLSISTVESAAFRESISKIPWRRAGPLPCRNIFSKYLENEYANMEVKLKRSVEELEYVSTTADLWTTHNKSFLGVTAHLINPHNMQRGKAALACRRFRGRHTYDSIASEIDNIHSSHGLSHKITATVTDNGSNFVKAFQVYKPHEDCEDNTDEVTFTNITDVLQRSGADDEDDMISLPPHKRCASHTLSLISCTDVDKWLLSTPETKNIYRNVTTKCAGLWNKESRSTVASEIVEDAIAKRLLVPCTTRWNSFYDALAWISEVPMVELNSISSKLQLKCISEREHHFLREYCAVMKPLTVALDILQGEDNCYYGTIIPTLKALMCKTLEMKNGLKILVRLPDVIVQAINSRFALVLKSEDTTLAAVTLQRFRLRWLCDQERKDRVKASLIAECRKQVLEQEQQPGKTPPTQRHSPGPTKEDKFFSFEEDEDNVTAEAEVADYLKSEATGTLNQFPMIKEIFLKHNAATPSSAPVERLFSLGNLTLRSEV
ncbi:uncharacterized protein LOC117824687 [Notolabrus celidotus]|uniref:uncharacterized protein LOC117824687 n=1 Tax=Notolabrus celidotus TaxID=1203425 RepID=UPI00149048B8|nr:uncharacterized protein LOC117824687 [Notolabrus celidotus]